MDAVGTAAGIHRVVARARVHVLTAQAVLEVVVTRAQVHAVAGIGHAAIDRVGAVARFDGRGHRVDAGIDQVVACAAAEVVATDGVRQRIGAVAAFQRVTLPAAHQRVVAVAARDQVEARLARDGIAVPIAVHRVVACTADGDVVARAQQHRIVARAAEDNVIARTGVHHHHIGAAAVDHVVAPVAQHRLIAGAADDGVVVVITDQVIVARFACEQVVAQSAVDLFVAVVTVDGIVAFAARDEVVGRVIHDDPVVAVAAQHEVDLARLAIIDGVAQEDRIVAVIALHHVAAAAHRDAVIAAAAIDEVVAAAQYLDVVVTRVAVERVVLVAEDRDDVVARVGHHQVVAAVAVDGIVAIAAVDLVDTRRVGQAVAKLNEVGAFVAFHQVVARAHQDVVVALFRSHVVVAVAQLDVIVAVAAHHQVVVIVGQQRVIARAAHQAVVAAVAVDQVIARTRVDRIGTRVAIQRIGAVAAKDRVVARVAEDLVVVRTRVHRVGRRTANHRVIAAARVDEVTLVGGKDQVVAKPAKERVGTASRRRIESHIAREQRGIQQVAAHRVGDVRILHARNRQRAGRTGQFRVAERVAGAAHQAHLVLAFARVELEDAAGRGPRELVDVQRQRVVARARHHREVLQLQPARHVHKLVVDRDDIVRRAAVVGRRIDVEVLDVVEAQRFHGHPAAGAADPLHVARHAIHRQHVVAVGRDQREVHEVIHHRRRQAAEVDRRAAANLDHPFAVLRAARRVGRVHRTHARSVAVHDDRPTRAIGNVKADRRRIHKRHRRVDRELRFGVGAVVEVIHPHLQRISLCTRDDDVGRVGERHILPSAVADVAVAAANLKRAAAVILDGLAFHVEVEGVARRRRRVVALQVARHPARQHVGVHMVRKLAAVEVLDRIGQLHRVARRHPILAQTHQVQVDGHASRRGRVIQRVAARPTGNRVRPGRRHDEQVVVHPAADVVAAIAARERVVAAVAGDGVGAHHAKDAVGAVVAHQAIVLHIPGNGVAARAADHIDDVADAARLARVDVAGGTRGQVHCHPGGVIAVIEPVEVAAAVDGAADLGAIHEHKRVGVGAAHQVLHRVEARHARHLARIIGRDVPHVGHIVGRQRVRTGPATKRATQGPAGHHKAVGVGAAVEVLNRAEAVADARHRACIGSTDHPRAGHVVAVEAVNTRPARHPAGEAAAGQVKQIRASATNQVLHRRKRAGNARYGARVGTRDGPRVAEVVARQRIAARPTAERAAQRAAADDEAVGVGAAVEVLNGAEAVANARHAARIRPADHPRAGHVVAVQAVDARATRHPARHAAASQVEEVGIGAAGQVLNRREGQCAHSVGNRARVAARHAPGARDVVARQRVGGKTAHQGLNRREARANARRHARARGRRGQGHFHRRGVGRVVQRVVAVLGVNEAADFRAVAEVERIVDVAANQVLHRAEAAINTRHPARIGARQCPDVGQVVGRQCVGAHAARNRAGQRAAGNHEAVSGRAADKVLDAAEAAADARHRARVGACHRPCVGHVVARQHIVARVAVDEARQRPTRERHVVGARAAHKVLDVAEPAANARHAAAIEARDKPIVGHVVAGQGVVAHRAVDPAAQRAAVEQEPVASRAAHQVLGAREVHPADGARIGAGNVPVAAIDAGQRIVAVAAVDGRGYRKAGLDHDRVAQARSDHQQARNRRELRIHRLEADGLRTAARARVNGQRSARAQEGHRLGQRRGHLLQVVARHLVVLQGDGLAAAGELEHAMVGHQVVVDRIKARVAQHETVIERHVAVVGVGEGVCHLVERVAAAQVEQVVAAVARVEPEAANRAEGHDRARVELIGPAGGIGHRHRQRVVGRIAAADHHAAAAAQRRSRVADDDLLHRHIVHVAVARRMQRVAIVGHHAAAAVEVERVVAQRPIQHARHVDRVRIHHVIGRRAKEVLDRIDQPQVIGPCHCLQQDRVVQVHRHRSRKAREVQRVAARAAQHAVVAARPHEEPVIVRTARDRVVAKAVVEVIVPVATADGVVARRAVDGVGAVVARQRVVGRVARQHVRRAAAAHVLNRRHSAANVGRRAGQEVHCHRRGVGAVVDQVGARPAVDAAADTHAVGQHDVVGFTAAEEVLDAVERVDIALAARVVGGDVPGRGQVVARQAVTARVAGDGPADAAARQNEAVVAAAARQVLNTRERQEVGHAAGIRASHGERPRHQALQRVAASAAAQGARQRARRRELEQVGAAAAEEVLHGLEAAHDRAAHAALVRARQAPGVGHVVAGEAVGTRAAHHTADAAAAHHEAVGRRAAHKALDARKAEAAVDVARVGARHRPCARRVGAHQRVVGGAAHHRFDAAEGAANARRRARLQVDADAGAVRRVVERVGAAIAVDVAAHAHPVAEHEAVGRRSTVEILEAGEVEGAVDVAAVVGRDGKRARARAASQRVALRRAHHVLDPAEAAADAARAARVGACQRHAHRAAVEVVVQRVGARAATNRAAHAHPIAEDELVGARAAVEVLEARKPDAAGDVAAVVDRQVPHVGRVGAGEHVAGAAAHQRLNAAEAAADARRAARRRASQGHADHAGVGPEVECVGVAVASNHAAHARAVRKHERVGLAAAHKVLEAAEARQRAVVARVGARDVPRRRQFGAHQAVVALAAHDGLDAGPTRRPAAVDPRRRQRGQVHRHRCQP